MDAEEEGLPNGVGVEAEGVHESGAPPASFCGVNDERGVFGQSVHGEREGEGLEEVFALPKTSTREIGRAHV